MLISLETQDKTEPRVPTFGVYAACDPRIDEVSRQRARNIVEMVANIIDKNVKMPNGGQVKVVYTSVLVDNEKQADTVARQFREKDVDAIICAPDTWAFPQLTSISLLSHFPPNIPFNITCGNSGPKPGVVFAHALNGALAQSGKMATLNVGTWPDLGQEPEMSNSTAEALIDWCYAALTFVGLKGRRVVIFGHDSMGMETALAHIIPTRDTFGLEITRLDMKLLSDMLTKGSYDHKELSRLREWIDTNIGQRLELENGGENQRFNQSLAMYLIIRNLMADLDAVGGGFMSQLEWGSDPRGNPLPVADVAESLFNSTFDHDGDKPAIPFATEADVQGLLTMLPMTWLSGGNPPLFMDLRKVWEPWEIQELAKKLGVSCQGNEPWYTRGIVDGNNSGSASFDWAAEPGASAEKCIENISLPLADKEYFPGGGNSVTFMTPAGIEGIAARLAFNALSGKFSMIWDQAKTQLMPKEIAEAVAQTSTPTWPHTFFTPTYATMVEYKQYAPANHVHMTWGLKPARLQYWMDLTGVRNVTPWQARPEWIEGVDRPKPLIHLI